MTPWEKVKTELDAPKKVYLVIAPDGYRGAFTTEQAATAAANKFLREDAEEYIEVWVDEVDNTTPVARLITRLKWLPNEAPAGVTVTVRV